MCLLTYLHWPGLMLWVQRHNSIYWMKLKKPRIDEPPEAAFNTTGNEPFFNGPNPASFCLFSFFSHDKYSTNLTIIAWDSNPGRQDGRPRRIHWAMAAPPNEPFLEGNTMFGSRRVKKSTISNGQVQRQRPSSCKQSINAAENSWAFAQTNERKDEHKAGKESKDKKRKRQ